MIAMAQIGAVVKRQPSLNPQLSQLHFVQLRVGGRQWHVSRRTQGRVRISFETRLAATGLSRLDSDNRHAFATSIVFLPVHSLEEEDAKHYEVMLYPVQRTRETMPSI
ncbi:hypothetical protein LIA77_11556 [Sarocladium implicatum]|nr:hypothetical protein LIA77_11556 [Sarocladium implicatum]